VPQVSIVIPSWNAAASVGRALDSVLAERGVELECVVVDDGSVDGTADVVREIAARDPRVVLVASPVNEGVSAARNRGLDAVRGEWLTFLDADDRLLPGAIGALHGAAVRAGAAAVVGQRVWSDGVRTWITNLYDRPDIRVPGRKSLRHNPGLMFYASATGKLFRRSCWDDLRFEGRVLGDQPWTIRALLRAGDRIEVIGDIVYEWTRPRPGNEFATITAAKHDSAQLAAEAVRVAVGALQTVADEADRALADPSDRHTVVAGYVDRLVRADFAGPVARAAAGSDRGAAELFEAVAAFLAAAPPEIVAGSAAIPSRLLWRPVAHWRRLAPATRAGLWAMVAATDAADRAAPTGPLGPRARTRLLAAAGAAWQGRARPVVDALLGLVSIVAEAGLALRARMRRAR
jgi:hypothetical protein